MTTIQQFVFNGDHSDVEQVRPWMDAYREVRAELDAAGQYPYNDSFKGRIPGIEGEREETAIYFLQTLHNRDKDREQVEAFGGTPVSDLEWADGQVRRGDLCRYGWYVGGTGFQVYTDVRVTPHQGGFRVIPKGKRNGFRLDGNLLFK